MNIATRLGIDLPILQAPMAGVQDGALAAAVCASGGLGSLPCAMLSLAALREQLQALTSRTGGRCNVNFFCHTPASPDEAREARWRARLDTYYKEYGIDESQAAPAPARSPFSQEAAELLAQFRPAVVSFHFGLPPPELLGRVKEWGAIVLSTATTLDEARWLEARGVDAIIAQGLEAGGHRGTFLDEDLSGQMGTFALVPQIARATSVPVIAAGGIADARGVAAAMALGAAGVQVGTAYLLCPEATTRAAHRAALEGPRASRTVLTNLFSGGAARGIPNRLTDELGPFEIGRASCRERVSTIV